MHRRVFLKSGALAVVSLGLSPALLRRVAFSGGLPSGTRGKTLVVLFQRGAADALNLVVPHGDPGYYALRTRTAVPRPGRAAGGLGALDLDGFYGLHPALAPLKPLYDRGLLAAVHAVGSPSSTRSHFDAQDYMESGTPDVKGTPDGWLNRYLAVRGTCEACAAPHDAPEAASHFRAVALAPQTPRIMAGPEPTIAMGSIAGFTVRATPGDDGAAARLERLYRTGSADLVHGAGADAFEAVRVLRAADPSRYAAANGARYPRSPLGTRLLEIAQLIKAGVGVEVAFTDVGGWDTHVNQGGATGQLANRLADLAAAVAAFTTDLGDRMEDVALVTMSEFGRTARDNGSGGTDHGHAGAMFVLGGAVRGGRVLGRWPGLAPEQLHEGRDLALTTDFRAVLSEIVAGHLGATRLDAVFPGYPARRLDWVGVL